MVLTTTSANSYQLLNTQNTTSTFHSSSTTEAGSITTSISTSKSKLYINATHEWPRHQENILKPQQALRATSNKLKLKQDHSMTMLCMLDNVVQQSITCRCKLLSSLRPCQHTHIHTPLKQIVRTSVCL